MHLTLTVDLRLDVTAPAAARSLSRAVLHQWGVHEAEPLDTAALVVTELVANALAHCPAEQSVGLHVGLADGAVRIAVADCDPRVPQQREPDLEEEGGRGLLLVSRLCASWGVERRDEGKQVWAVLPVPVAAPAAGAGAGRG